jgi:hypothetical protein
MKSRGPERRGSALLVTRHSSLTTGFERLRLHQRSREESLLALDYDAFTRLESVQDNPHRANTFSELDGAKGDPVVLSHEVNLVAALQLGDRRLRDE